MSGHADSPAPLLERTFGHIAETRMAGLPIVNPRLAVEALGFALRGDAWSGILVTPWCMNLLLLPALGRPWEHLPVGEKRGLTLPAGPFEIFGGQEDQVGEYHYVSLFSPMSDFLDAAGAAETAREALALLYREDTRQQLAPQADPRELAASAHAPLEKPLSRRGFLFGARQRG